MWQSRCPGDELSDTNPVQPALAAFVSENQPTAKAIAFRISWLCAGSAAVGQDAGSECCPPAALAADCTSMVR